ncbi:uncharacterized protein isoform X2 [Rhodnius prolixus]|uniref:uncharacterized protein isoform X2 n=1 Tax=Rhodnius prolixus TaxID=13249 RepID=UPI003D18B874
MNEKFEGGGDFTSDEEGASADERYLTLVGLSGDHPRLYPDDVWTNSSLPVVVSYVRTGDLGQAVGLARNIAHFLPNHTLLIYNFGLPEQQLQTLANYCNNSRCVLVKFELSVFPPHVSDENLHAFRPLIIQDAVSRTGAVFYLENDQRLTTSEIGTLIHRASSNGVVTWRVASRPVTALTHPRMFKYLQSPAAEYFYFTPMVDLSRLLMYNTQQVRQSVLLPWVKCALNHDCIQPIGAQSGGCRFDKKPNYRYSGCHGHDASALSVLLGLFYNFDSDIYSISIPENNNNNNNVGSRSGTGVGGNWPTEEGTSPTSGGGSTLNVLGASVAASNNKHRQANSIFRRVDSTEAALELLSLQDNSTDSTTL